MKTNIVDVYVRVKSDKGQSAIESVLQKIARTAGVRKAGLNSHVPSLLAVQYDPASVSSQGILASIRQQGYQASLIGM